MISILTTEHTKYTKRSHGRTRRGRVPTRGWPVGTFPRNVRSLVVTSFLVALSAVASGEETANGAKRLVVGDPPPHTTGAFRPFVIPGEIEESDGFVELRQGRGMTVWCPGRAAQENPEKVAAARRFVDSLFLPVGSVSVAYFGETGGARVLESLGVQFKRHDARWLPSSAQTQLVVIGPGAGKSLKTPEEEKSFHEWLSSRTVLMLPGADLSILPFGLSTSRATLKAADATVPDLPVFAGIGRDFGEFLRLADGAPCDVVAGGPAWMLAASPACLAHVKNRGVSIVILTVAPGDVPEPARAALSRIWCTILANLNVETPLS